MLIVLMVICMLLFIMGLLIDNANISEIVGVTGGLCFLIFGIITICVTVEYVGNRTVDDKIAMYQEENKKIEEKIEVTVKQYMDFEKDTYKNLKVDTYINLVSLYPELKSDTLIKEQIKTYQKNNDKIKDLKLAKIDQKTRKWWLFFGR